MNTFHYKIQPFTEQSIYISLGVGISEDYLAVIHSLMKELNVQQMMGVIEAVPGYNNITVYYDPYLLSKKYRMTDVQTAFIKNINNWIKQVAIVSNQENEAGIEITIGKTSRTKQVPPG